MNLTHFSLHFPTPVLAHSTALTVLIAKALPLVLEFQLEQCPGTPPPTHLATSWTSCGPVLLEDISESSHLVSCFSSETSQLPVLLTIVIFIFCYNGLFMHLYPTLPN